MGKRVFLFLLTNILVLVTVSIILHATGLRFYLTRSGINYNVLIGFCLIWGMAGSFISLALSKQMAKWMMGVQIVDPRETDPALRSVVDMVERMSKTAGLPKTPEVGIYDSPEINAFATGPSKSNSLVAVSAGLLDNMSEDEVEGVIGHEIAHIANGDMVTMTLLQGVVNAFVMFFARAAAFAILQLASGDDDESPIGGLGSYFAYMFLTAILEAIFMILGSLVVNGFSRWREYHADAGGAKLAGRSKMLNALRALQSIQYPDDMDDAHPAFRKMQISNRKGGWLAFFSTHPPLEERIKRLESMRNI